MIIACKQLADLKISQNTGNGFNTYRYLKITLQCYLKNHAHSAFNQRQLLAVLGFRAPKSLVKVKFNPLSLPRPNQSYNAIQLQSTWWKFCFSMMCGREFTPVQILPYSQCHKYFISGCAFLSVKADKKYFGYQICDLWFNDAELSVHHTCCICSGVSLSTPCPLQLNVF